MSGGGSAATIDKPPVEGKLKIVLMSAGIGIARGLIGFPVEQPLESIKT